MAPCAECGFDWDTNHHHLIEIIERAPREFDTLLASHPRSTLDRRPDRDTWSPLEYTVHTGAALQFYAHRIDIVLTTDRPQLAPYDFDAACERDRYNERAVEEALDLIAGAATLLSGRLRPLEPDDWQRVGIGSGGDERTVEWLARSAAHEVVHHQLDIERQLA